MRGHVRKRGSTWAVVVDVGRQPSRSCPSCRTRYWTADGRRETCARCGADLLSEREERRQQWHGGFPTRREAQQELPEILGRLNRGTYIPPSRVTFGQFLLEEWLPAIESTVRATTLASYRVNITKHVVPALGALPLQKLSPAALNGFYAKLLAGGRRDGQGLAPKTARNIHVVIHKALADALRWGRVTRNVAEVADPPRVGRRQMNVWAPPELRRFLSHVRDDRLYAAWLLLATTGMRRGEALGLRWQDVDLDAGHTAITQTLVVVDGKPATSEPKTSKGRRQLALDPATVAALREHRKRQLEERMAWGPAWQDSGLVFTREDGSLIHPEAFADQFLRRASAAGLRRIRLHDLRHSYASAALAAGVHPKVVSERLGHATVSITLDTYSHAIAGLQEEAANRVAAMILGA